MTDACGKSLGVGADPACSPGEPDEGSNAPGVEARTTTLAWDCGREVAVGLRSRPSSWSWAVPSSSSPSTGHLAGARDADGRAGAPPASEARVDRRRSDRPLRSSRPSWTWRHGQSTYGQPPPRASALGHRSFVQESGTASSPTHRYLRGRRFGHGLHPPGRFVLAHAQLTRSRVVRPAHLGAAGGGHGRAPGRGDQHDGRCHAFAPATVLVGSSHHPSSTAREPG